MESYIKLSLRNLPDHFILHVKKNYLVSIRTSEKTTTSIINLALSLEGELLGLNISSIIFRTDVKWLHK